MSVYKSASTIYGEENFKKIAESKILVVGAGGIGCEILKNLAFSGCKNIELIDLDTIDVSNLNRQFLFRPEHVGQPKAIVAAKAAEKFNPDIKVTAHHDNIKNPQFSVSYIANFNVVLNALDNIDARRHVNRLCLAANVPLIDSGTTGYLGQVMPIMKGITACYECFPKPTQKVYPICTIRSTPDKPVHCIVWAKECFKLLFGKPSESMLFEDPSSGEISTYMHLVAHPATTSAENAPIEAILTYGHNLVTALFYTEIKKRIAMDVYKTAKVVPEPISAELILNAVTDTRLILTTPQSVEGRRPAIPSQVSGWDQRVFSLHDCVVEFLLSLHSVTASLLGQLSFDKDDIWAMKFVTAASNLRSSVFSIPLLSFHDAKGIAGNIIPAIATTNAIVAGVQVMQALKLITRPREHDDDKSLLRMCPHTYCLRLPTRKGYFLQPSAAEGPVSSCYVCGTSQLTLQVDIHKNTLGDVVSKVIKGRLGFNEPSIMLGSSFLYEEGDGADEDLQENLALLLSECPAGGIQEGTLLTLVDFTQKLELQLLVKHVSNEDLAKIESAATDLFIVEGHDAFQKRQAEATTAIVAKETQADLVPTSSSHNSSEEIVSNTVAILDDDCVVMEHIDVQIHHEQQQHGVKRSGVDNVDEEILEIATNTKRQRVD